jgi:hypothetical protein
MDRARIAAMVRHFPENGLKMLLEHPGNVRDLFHILRWPLADRVEFDRMQVQPATFIARDFRHVESDILLTAPFRGAGRRAVAIYILIEHQSEPDRLMRFRVLDYVVQVYKVQLREWAQANSTFADFQFRPVLPVVFYTGGRPWSELAGLAEQTTLGPQFRDILPAIEPIFLNLGTADPAALEREGGPFGQVMRVLRDAHASVDTFRGLHGRGALAGNADAAARAPAVAGVDDLPGRAGVSLSRRSRATGAARPNPRLGAIGTSPSGGAGHAEDRS